MAHYRVYISKDNTDHSVLLENTVLHTALYLTQSSVLHVGMDVHVFVRIMPLCGLPSSTLIRNRDECLQLLL
jgi:hypothetical protein